MINRKTGNGIAAIFILLAMAFLLSGCTSNAAPAGGNNSVSSAGGGKLVEINMTAKQWAFDPATITVNKGDHVRITITSLDVTHGFALPDYGINQQIIPGKQVVVDFVADKPGTFTFFCSVMCGPGHRGQKGTLTVNP